jgi:hypothetical protein
MTAVEAKRVDILTIAGIAALAYVLSTLAHEGLGHGGACLAVGARPVAWGAYYFDCNTDGLAVWAGRQVSATGSTVNLGLCLIMAVLLGRDLKTPDTHGAWTVFLWLMFAINAFTWAGYFLFSGIAGIGDWGPDGVLKGVADPLIWRAGMAIIGAGLYVWLAKVGADFLGRIVGGGRLDLARRISWTAYVTGAVVSVLIGLLNPIGFLIVLISSMASSLGGTSGLFWGFRMMKRDTVGVAFDLPRQWVWIILGALAAIAYAACLGRSYQF